MNRGPRIHRLSFAWDPEQSGHIRSEYIEARLSNMSDATLWVFNTIVFLPPRLRPTMGPMTNHIKARPNCAPGSSLTILEFPLSKREPIFVGQLEDVANNG